MPKRPLLTVVIAVGWAVASAGPTWAQDASLDAARKEGKVVWYTVAAVKVAERVAKMFEQHHSGLKVEVHRGGGERMLQRLLQEASAGIKNCDVFETADSGHIPLLKRRGMLARYTPQGADRFPDAFKDTDGMAFAWRAFPVIVQYNPKLVAKSDAPRSWKDLLDPKWKGKLVTAHPGYSGSVLTQIYALVNLYGWDYWKQLAQQKPMIVQSVHDPYQVVTSGERAVGVNGAEYFVYTQRQKGNAVEIVYPQEGVPLITIPVTILNAAPHPNAARLFSDFLFSKPVQQLMADEEGAYVPNPDVSYPADKPRLNELKLLPPVDPDDLERRNEEIKKRFTELFGA
ncbi:MAG TPA: extracellular solute-binding protein [Methylomirabilota bacterium]|jgi:iron(III) transport system substrate-binding protein|nr:extracellular solute-binding protein [Methylomirabilota bacterium]